MMQPSPVPGPRPGTTSDDRSQADVEVPAGVVQALARLEQLDGLPVSEHIEVFDDVHRLLQDCLATLDEA